MNRYMEEQGEQDGVGVDERGRAGEMSLERQSMPLAYLVSDKRISLRLLVSTRYNRFTAKTRYPKPL